MDADKTTVRNRIRTQAMVAMAVLALFAGASVGASLEEFAAPTYAEDNAYSGAVDDATDERGWKAIDSDKGMMKGAKSLIGKSMPGKMDDRMEDREAHLEERMAIGQEIVIAYQYCLDSAECRVDSAELQEMIDNINARHTEMQEKLNSDDNELSEENTPRFTDDDASQEDCEAAGGTWSEDRQACYSEEEREDADDEVEERFDCRTRELWSADKQEWCDAFMDKDDWGEWDIDRKMDFADDRAMMLESGRVAISFCLNSEDCTADREVLGEVLEHMSARHDNHRDCSEEERCERGDDDRRGLLHRLRDAMRRGPQGGADHPAPHMDIGPDICEERGGEWTEAPDRGEGFYYCNFWFDDDRQNSDEEMTQDDREEESADEDDDREEESNETDDDASQEDCEASGGTWSEERQYCY